MYSRSLGRVEWGSFLCVCAIWLIATHVVVYHFVVHYRRGMQTVGRSAGSRESGGTSNAGTDSNDHRRLYSTNKMKEEERVLRQ